MNKQELIERLLDCSRALSRLAEDLQTAEAEDAAAGAPAFESAEAEEAPAEDCPKADAPPAETPPAEVKASAANPFARLFAGLGQTGGSIPIGANPFNLLNMLASGKGIGLPGLNPGEGGLNLPETLTELHDNPQVLGMLNRVASNPQSLNLISSLTGQSPAALQSALQSLQPAPAEPAPALPAAAAMPAVAPAAAMPAAPQLPPAPGATHLDSLLAEWHWQPYARVWAR